MKSFLLVVSPLLLLIITGGKCQRLHPKDISIARNSVEELPQNPTSQGLSWKSRNLRNLVDMALCIGTLDGKCILDKADLMVVDANKSFWDEADAQVVESGRAEESSKPSALMDSLNSIISELTDMFKDGISGLFRDGKENSNDETELEEGDEEEEGDKDEAKEDKSRQVEEGRGKKKKKKKAIIKLLLLGAVAATKIKLILKALAIHLQVKFLFIALASLLLNAARFYLELKKGHQPQKVIYYEHAQHQHHYDGGEEDWHGGWSRSYDETKKFAQDSAYSKQKPQGLVYTKVNDKPNYSWDQ
ncbi:uncharacterized protein [Onthophagus taurus]|uniref:uncharacterized protein n=1 Tax=Onthophagus taurus TaxID=166361 RepID=UPI0039BDC711